MLRITGDWKLENPLGYYKGFGIFRDWTKNERSVTVEQPLSSERSPVPLRNDMVTE